MEGNLSKTFLRTLQFFFIVGLLTFLLSFLIVMRNDQSPLRSKLSHLPFFSNVIEQNNQTRLKARTTTLNHYIPSFDDLIVITRQPHNARLDILRQYIGYFELVVQYFPHMWDAHGILGYSYFYSGDKEKAIHALQKAIELNPYFFFPRYNLGMIYLIEGDAPKAKELFKQALSVPPTVTVKMIHESKIYQQIFKDRSDVSENMEASLKEAYQKCYEMFVESDQKLKRRSVGFQSDKELRIF